MHTGLGPCCIPLKFWRSNFNSFRVIRLFGKSYWPLPNVFGYRYRPQIRHAYEPLTHLYVTKIWESYLQLFPRNWTFWEFAPTLTLTPYGQPQTWHTNAPMSPCFLTVDIVPKMGMRTSPRPLSMLQKFGNPLSNRFREIELFGNLPQP